MPYTIPQSSPFYRWYNGNIYIYIYTQLFIYLHIKTIPRWFMALFYPHYIGFSMGFSDLFPSGPAVPQSSRIPKTRSKATREVLANGILPWMKRILDVETYVKHYTYTYNVYIYIYIYNYIYYIISFYIIYNISLYHQLVVGNVYEPYNNIGLRK